MTPPTSARPAGCLCSWEEADPACPVDHTGPASAPLLCGSVYDPGQGSTVCCAAPAGHPGNHVCGRFVWPRLGETLPALDAGATAQPVLRAVPTMAGSESPARMTPEEVSAARERAADVAALRLVSSPPNELRAAEVRLAVRAMKSSADVPALCDEVERTDRAMTITMQMALDRDATIAQIHRELDGESFAFRMQRAETERLISEGERLRGERDAALARADAAESALAAAEIALAKALAAVRLT